MDRRTFNKLAGLATIRAITDNQEFHAQSNNAARAALATADGEIVLEDNELLVAFDASSGALTRLEKKSTLIRQEFNKMIDAKVDLPSAGRFMMATPGQPDGQPANGRLSIPARSAAVVIEV